MESVQSLTGEFPHASGTDKKKKKRKERITELQLITLFAVTVSSFVVIFDLLEVTQCFLFK